MFARLAAILMEQKMELVLFQQCPKRVDWKKLQNGFDQRKI